MLNPFFCQSHFLLWKLVVRSRFEAEDKVEEEEEEEEEEEKVFSCLELLAPAPGGPERGEGWLRAGLWGPRGGEGDPRRFLRKEVRTTRGPRGGLEAHSR